MKSKQKENTTPLSKHKREGKKLIPPLLQIPSFSPRSWINDALPEMAWAILLITHLEREEALGVFREVTDFLSSSVVGLTPKEIKVCPTITGFSLLSDSNFEKLLKIITHKDEYRKALSPLLFYRNLPRYKDWQRFIGIEPKSEDWKKIKKAVARTLFHQSQEATDCRWVSVLFEIKSNRLHVYEETEKEILEYPNYGDMRKVRPTIRATELAGFSLLKIDKKWANDFWNNSMKLTTCEALEEKTEADKEIPKELIKKINQKFSEIFHGFFQTLKSTAIEPKKDAVYGLTLYAWRLTAEIVFSGTSQMVLGRLGLRSMAECYIVLSYLIQEDKEELWKEYRSYGTGQAKLAYQKFEELGETPAYFDSKTMNEIVNEDVWIEFVPVNLGHWEKADLRKIAEKSKTKEIYDKYYSWPSNYSHGQWGAVRETVFQTCLNPLHRLHRIPLSRDRVFPNAADDALLLFDLVLEKFNEVYPKKEIKK